ncbi:hypothetical protein F0562_018671 [Nyssa sinensis]|uniref:Receptor-like serine/threonine-protein kinase n=1 Tax=Nyssa sinensis TaxID=561372 RepID=A0A5J4ZE05_9ASTE|nr:hypothetical protein F0562_018671 [Nyssa sinensis]
MFLQLLTWKPRIPEMASLALPQLRSLFLLLLFALFPVVFAVSESDCRINLGYSLSAGDNSSWISSSGEFAFGFRPPDPQSNANVFLLAIWFDKIPAKTIVWFANVDPVPRGSKVTLTDSGELILYNTSDTVIWKAETNSSTTSTCAAMLDSGNFVLVNGSNPVWESFKHPTDTILPTQILGINSKLTSRQSETNYNKSRFQLIMQGDGNLVLYTVAMPTETIYGAYWASGTQHNPNNRSNFQLIFEEAGYINITKGQETIYTFPKTTMVSTSSQDFYHMARIDPNGVFTLYNYPRKGSTSGGTCTSSWNIVRTVPDDVCAILRYLGSGACGYNSYCENKNGRPSYYDLQIGDEDHEVNIEECKQYCLEDCFCAVAIHGDNKCWKKKFPLSNGRKTKNVNLTAIIKVANANATKLRLLETCQNQSKDQSTLILAGSIILSSSVFLNFLLLLAISVAVCFSYHKKLLNLQSVSNTSAMNVRSYAYKELEEATGGFKQKLGKGGFGSVYKGVLPSDPKRFIAVKKLDKLVQEGEKEFKTEVSVIGQTHHKNLVRLLGYCNEGEHRLLVYEYMSNGSLASLLFGISRPDWNQRVQIAFGIARGLMYLHEECSTQIIHCDIKPQNILLDEYFTPRIADFGLAKLLLAEQTRTARTGIRGTIGYFAPEWFRKVSITVKVDVYSFGALLLEIICCKSAVEFAMGNEEQALIDWAYDCYCKRRLDKLVENDEEARNDMKRLERLVQVAIWCIQDDPSLRPSMRKVTQMLEGVIEVSIPPRPI